MQEGTVLSVIRRKSDKTKRRQGMRPLVFLFPLKGDRGTFNSSSPGPQKGKEKAKEDKVCVPLSSLWVNVFRKNRKTV